MTDKAYVLAILKTYGRTAAEDLQNRAERMTATELNAEDYLIPGFRAACERANMLDRKVGFVCRSTAGRVVRLLQPYDSTIYPQEPEELAAHWGFAWSTDPVKARPFIAVSTSPYATGHCCTYDGRVWRSGQDGNIWAPGTPGVSWEDLGPAEPE